jgi:hypothetical protein
LLHQILNLKGVLLFTELKRNLSKGSSERGGLKGTFLLESAVARERAENEDPSAEINKLDIQERQIEDEGGPMVDVNRKSDNLKWASRIHVQLPESLLFVYNLH